MEWLSSVGITLTFWCAALIYLIPLRRRPHFAWRVAAGLTVGSPAAVLLARQCIYSEETTVLMFLLFYVFAVAFLSGCAEIDLTAAVYCGVWVVVTQQLAIEMEGILLSLWQSGQGEDVVLKMLGMLLFYAVWYVLIGLTIARWMPEQGDYKIGPRQLISALVLLILFELLMWLLVTHNSSAYSVAGKMIIIFAQLYCVTILYMQSTLFKKSAMQQELQALNLLHGQQAEQYHITKENIDLINRKCHDLKHQVSAIRHMTEDEERDRYLKEIEGSIQIYSAIVQTGNEALDTLLTEKSLRCIERKITINCVVDGASLDFIAPVDLYTIFGNAIDNAIESVEQIKTADKRQIDVIVYRQQCFLLVNIINPLGREPRFEGEFPVTTKQDKDYHGYGLKSIQRTAKKYDGFVSISVEDGCFSLKILFPVR